jgi:predicted acylesterase/phospholipase RssA
MKKKLNSKTAVVFAGGGSLGAVQVGTRRLPTIIVSHLEL